MERVIAYIDGFNLYFGMKEKCWNRYYWLNPKLLMENLINENQKLEFIKYFTARITLPYDKMKRQAEYIEALETIQNMKIIYGHYLSDYINCWNCGNKILKHNEKMTDVNIAVEMLKDAYGNNFDKAFLISADSDLVAPVKTIREHFPYKQVIIAFPPERSSKQLKQYANGHFTIGRKNLAKSQFPDEVTKPGGFILKRPENWS